MINTMLTTRALFTESNAVCIDQKINFIGRYIMLSKKFFKTKDEAEVTFEFARDDVTKVELVADFNSWQPIAMKFNKKTKVFKAKVRLAKNESFQFRYRLNDQEWENDYQADQYLPNNLGTENSVVKTF